MTMKRRGIKIIYLGDQNSMFKTSPLSYTLIKTVY